MSQSHVASHKQEDELAQNIKKLEGKVAELNVRLEDKGRAGRHTVYVCCAFSGGRMYVCMYYARTVFVRTFIHACTLLLTHTHLLTSGMASACD